jgi:RNA polymerase sigma factor (sigma-70 family)
MDEYTKALDVIISKVFFSYMKRVMLRTASNYIRGANSHEARAILLEDIPKQELERCLMTLPCETVQEAKQRNNYHIHLQNRFLADVIPELDDRDRDIIFLLYYEEMTMDKAAEVLGVSQQAVSKRAKKLLGRLFSYER